MKLKLLLDLDNTLISSIAVDEIEWTKENKNKSLKFNFHDMEDYYVVYERPGLQDFLDFVFENFDVSIWSAATKNYVLFVIKNIILTKSNRNLEYVFFSYHCDWSKKMFRGVKNLKLLYKLKVKGFNSSNTIILDDLDKVQKHNPYNCIPIKDFEYMDENSENDNELSIIKKKLEKILEMHSLGKLNEKYILQNKIDVKND